MAIAAMTNRELKAKAKAMGAPGFRSRPPMRKSELVAVVLAATRAAAGAEARLLAAPDNVFSRIVPFLES